MESTTPRSLAPAQVALWPLSEPTFSEGPEYEKLY